MIGSPAATAEPGTSSRITIAAAIPILSLAPVSGRAPLADVAANGHLQARLLRWIGGVEHRVALVLGDAPLADVERHRYVADLLVLASALDPASLKGLTAAVTCGVFFRRSPIA